MRQTRSGNGLYGVDIKNNNGDAYVIEVNDNPSIESGEDDCYPRVFEQIVDPSFCGVITMTEDWLITS